MVNASSTKAATSRTKTTQKRAPARLVRRFPLLALELIAPFEPAPDRAILARPEVRAALVDDLRQALRQGPRAALDDLRLLSQPWGFRLEDIAVPVELWHGEADAQVPVGVGRRVAQRLPDCRARFIPEAGHLWLFEHCAEVLGTLCPPAPSTPA